MFSQLLYFIVALLLFTIQQPGPKPFAPPLETFCFAGLTFLLFVFICRKAFLLLKAGLREGMPQTGLALSYHRTLGRLSILALVALAIDVYALNIKYYLLQLPGVSHSVTLLELLGLLIFALHLSIIWFFGHSIYRRLHQSDISRGAFIRGNLSFSSAVLIPWLLISLVSDLFQWFKTDTFIGSELGQLMLLGFLMLCFTLFAPPLVVSLWGCESLQKGSLRTHLDQFCGEHRFRVADFKLWPLFGGEMLTAGIVGILPGYRYILITRGLLNLLNADELESVVAHEMGHARRYHLLFYLLLFLLFSASWVFTYPVYAEMLFLLLRSGGLLKWLLLSDSFGPSLISLLQSLPVVLLLVLFFRYIFGFFMRNSERQADLYALQLLGHPRGLISSLQKIAFYSGRIEDLPSWHHFSIRQRIQFLVQASKDPELPKRHDRKLYSAAVIFLLIIFSLTALGLQLSTLEFYKRWRLDAQIDAVEHALRSSPQSPKLMGYYGGLLLEAGRIAEAESALEDALDLAPEDPTLLNNLAWLHATSPPPHFIPTKALELASRAAELEPSPHILDTLAEAYFINSQYENALKTIEGAIEKGPKNRDYYLRQKGKFEDALRHQEAD